jgi:hypothetical protein
MLLLHVFKMFSSTLEYILIIYQKCDIRECDNNDFVYWATQKRSFTIEGHLTESENVFPQDSRAGFFYFFKIAHKEAILLPGKQDWIWVSYARD